MKKLLFLSLVILCLACEKSDTPNNYKCTRIITKIQEGVIPIPEIYIGYPVFTSEEARAYQRQNNHYGYDIVGSDTIGIIVHSCNCEIINK
jgi:hypothetical protein